MAECHSVWRLYSLPKYSWVLSRYSSFILQSKNMHVAQAVCTVVCLCVGLDGLTSCGVYPVSHLLSAGDWNQPNLQPCEDKPGTEHGMENQSKWQYVGCQ
ncbi:hypothetical protein AMECASPLE_002458 [Ameca splendens]|uniref:Uncharacterized protein n=1 Tax=Ameca splendens TaxID=208324 RepID=A0ABV0XY44_9TELE